jgi:superfamily II DNA or RNA helicase
VSLFTLRDYQEDTIAAHYRAWRGEARGTGKGKVNRTVSVLPTGDGKAVILSHLAAKWIRENGSKVLVLVHRNELAVQTRNKLHGADPSLLIGTVKAAQNEIWADVIVGSTQTLAYESRRKQIRNVGLIIYDECHHATAPTSLAILEDFGAFAATPAAGFTATLTRSDRSHLGDVWQEVVYQRDIIDGIRGGSLVDARGKRVQIRGLDLSAVRSAKRSDNGERDMRDSDVARALENADAPDQVAQAYQEHAADRIGVVFWPSVAMAYAGAQATNDAGLRSSVVEGETPLGERSAIYADLAAGRTQLVHNCMVLTEGWDCPPVSCAVIARPTESAGLYTQMAGRVLRPHHEPIPGFADKRDALILDVVGVSGRHKLATLADLTMSVDDVGQDESIAEAADRAELEAAQELAAAGQLLPSDLDELQDLQQQRERERVAREVELFASDSAVWLQTAGGIRFIPIGEWLLFLWPQDYGLFSVGTCRNSDHKPFMDSRVLAKDMTLPYAQAHARQLAEQADPRGMAQRAASWRDRTDAPYSLRQMARQRGIKRYSTMGRAQLQDAISVAVATKALGG